MGNGDVTAADLRPMSTPLIFIYYGTVGLGYEVVFTAIFDLLIIYFESDMPMMTDRHEWQLLRGVSSLYSFLIYGTCATFAHRLYVEKLKDHSRWVRVAFFVILVYTWEFTSGIILKSFDACPWNYEHYDGHFMGVVCLEYLPIWTIAAVAQDWHCRLLDSVRFVPMRKEKSS